MYGINYYENLLRMYSKSAEEICKIRWDFVAETKPCIVLDYGCGCGWFRAFRPKGITMDSYDIMPTAQTGIRHERYDLITFWDVLEHMPGFEGIKDLLDKARFVAITVPIKPDGIKIENWKHTKPLEHIVTFNHEMIEALFSEFGYNLIKVGQPECPPRVDIWSFLFGK